MQPLHRLPYFMFCVQDFLINSSMYILFHYKLLISAYLFQTLVYAQKRAEMAPQCMQCLDDGSNHVHNCHAHSAPLIGRCLDGGSNHVPKSCS